MDTEENKTTKFMVGNLINEGWIAWRKAGSPRIETYDDRKEISPNGDVQTARGSKAEEAWRRDCWERLRHPC